VKKLKKTFYFLLTLFILSFHFGALSTKAAGASLYLSPSSGTRYVGGSFYVTVRLNTGGVAINAVEGTISFNNKLEVISLSKSGSFINLWVPPELTFSNSSRTIRFAGGTTSPFNGSGTVFTISFRAKSIGVGTASVTSGKVLTYGASPVNILTSRGRGSYTISSVSLLPSAPRITCPTHPDQNKWYKNNSPKFTWKLYSGVSGVSFSFNRQATSYPDSTSEGLLTSNSYKDINDGIRYFHLRFYTRGDWGYTSHYRVQIDTRPPEQFKITVDNKGSPTNPQPTLLFKTTDTPSGIDFYSIKIGKKQEKKVKKPSYQSPLLLPGKYTITVKAVDKAGNYTIETTKMTIESIESPVITDYPKILYLGDPFWLKGESFSNATIHIFIQKEGGEEVFQIKVKSDKKGHFSYDHDRLLEKGRYKIWAVAEDARGARSNPSEKLPVNVGPCAFLKIGPITISYMWAVIFLLLLIAILALLIWRGWEEYKKKRRRLRKEVTETEKALHKASDIFKGKIEKEIEMLDLKPGLSVEEMKIRDDLKKALNSSERLIDKEIKDIRKELEKPLKEKFLKKFSNKFFKKRGRKK